MPATAMHTRAKGARTAASPRAKAQKRWNIPTGPDEDGIEVIPRAIITAERAGEWLPKVGVNRHRRRKKVRQYRDDLLADRWRYIKNCAPIIFDSTGELIDGQQRMAALLLAAEENPNVFLEVDILMGVDPTLKTVIDSGASRSGADAIAFMGGDDGEPVKNRSTISSTVRFMLGEETGRDRHVFSNSEMVAYAAEYGLDRLREAATFAHHVYKAMAPLTPTSLAYCYLKLGDVNKKQRDQFFEEWIDNVGPFFGAANRRLKNAMNRKERVHNKVYVAAIIRTWNNWMKEETLGNFPLTNPQGAPVKLPPIITKRDLK
jgi:hypothetical protein